ncbi:PaaI family thioesterase [Pseudodonghicola flavimaris]|uniref:PaaI family thioesterase n=1 Tax=Pseudodonghicola flavimaris TaxID=3050036 RepID=A0ABT7F302_9RHOB|nr:PaaI family thioesterase [Pseudodonghicola flavimaris]MDK3018985.1 PaaI family thioesterase [Pseudodonghicola flavimaris]
MPSAPHDPVPAAEVARHGSGAQELIGYRLDLSGADGAGRVVLDIEPRHLNRNGTLHGGIVAMMLDVASGFAVARSAPTPGLGSTATVSLSTHYVAPARSGRVVATGRVTGGGRTIAYTQAELHDAEGALCASAAGVFRRILPKGRP